MRYDPAHYGYPMVEEDARPVAADRRDSSSYRLLGDQGTEVSDDSWGYGGPSIPYEREERPRPTGAYQVDYPVGPSHYAPQFALYSELEGAFGPQVSWTERQSTLLSRVLGLLKRLVLPATLVL